MSGQSRVDGTRLERNRDGLYHMNEYSVCLDVDKKGQGQCVDTVRTGYSDTVMGVDAGQLAW